MMLCSRRSLLRAIALTSLLLAGCGSSEPNFVAVGPSNNPNPAPAYAQRLTPRLQTLMGEMMVPGAVVVVRSPELGDWSAAFVFRDLQKTQAVTIADHFRIGSNTKTMTGTVVLQLVEEGLVDLDDPIGDYIDGVPNGDLITIENLLEMRSGLPNYTMNLYLNQQLDEDRFRVWMPSELLALAFGGDIQPPDTEYEYSNTNTVLLGQLIEELTGQVAEDAIAERIFAPLGLDETSLPLAADNSIAQPHARGYMYSTNVATIESSVLSPADQAAALAGTLLPSDQTFSSHSWTWTAGSAISTAEDLAVYARALVQGGLLGPELQAARLNSMQPSNPAEPAAGAYGWALAEMGPTYGHIGALPGYNSFMGHDPDRDLTVIVFTNLNSSPQGKAPAAQLAMSIIDELYGEPLHPDETADIDP